MRIYNEQRRGNRPPLARAENSAFPFPQLPRLSSRGSRVSQHSPPVFSVVFTTDPRLSRYFDSRANHSLSYSRETRRGEFFLPLSFPFARKNSGSHCSRRPQPRERKTGVRGGEEGHGSAAEWNQVRGSGRGQTPERDESPAV